MKAVISGVRARNCVRSPGESMATPGQNVSSKTKKTLRRAMMTLRQAKAQVLVHSARRPLTCNAGLAVELNEDLLEVRLPHLALPDHHALLVEPPQELGQPFVGHVHRALEGLVPDAVLQHPRQRGKACRLQGVEPQRGPPPPPA